MNAYRYLVCATVLAGISIFPSLGHGDVSNLQDLISGGELMQGNTTFSNFQLLGDFGTTAIDPGQILVEAIEGSSLEIFGNGQFSLSPGDESVIFQIGFDATTTGTDWLVSGVDLTGGNFTTGDFGLVDVFNSISDSNAGLLAETNAVVDPGFGVSVLSDSESLGSTHSGVSFVSSFSLFADSTANVSIDSYRVSLSVPEPTSVALLSGLTIFSLSRRRK